MRVQIPDAGEGGAGLLAAGLHGYAASYSELPGAPGSLQLGSQQMCFDCRTGPPCFGRKAIFSMHLGRGFMRDNPGPAVDFRASLSQAEALLRKYKQVTWVP